VGSVVAQKGLPARRGRTATPSRGLTRLHGLHRIRRVAVSARGGPPNLTREGGTDNGAYPAAARSAGTFGRDIHDIVLNLP
jgi:hypothetical protein